MPNSAILFVTRIKSYRKRKITKILHEEKIPTPAAYAKAQGMNHYSAMTAHDDECYWCDDTVGDMLRD